MISLCDLALVASSLDILPARSLFMFAVDTHIYIQTHVYVHTTSGVMETLLENIGVTLKKLVSLRSREIESSAT